MKIDPEDRPLIRAQIVRIINELSIWEEYLRLHGATAVADDLANIITKFKEKLCQL